MQESENDIEGMCVSFSPFNLAEHVCKEEMDSQTNRVGRTTYLFLYKFQSSKQRREKKD